MTAFLWHGNLLVTRESRTNSHDAVTAAFLAAQNSLI
ncbi:UNVERIFIED_ORG: hypothetical protein BDU10_7490 [Burkholderia sp. CF145]